jgi:hypothetical protein
LLINLQIRLSSAGKEITQENAGQKAKTASAETL